MPDEADIDTRRMPPVTGRALAQTRQHLAAAGALAVAAFALYFLPAFLGRPLYFYPEEFQVAIETSALLHGESSSPEAPVPAAVPPLEPWLAAQSAKLLNPGRASTAETLSPEIAQAVEFPPALLGALAMFLVVLYGNMVLGGKAGLLAGIILGLSPLACHHAVRGSADMTLMFTCAGMFCGTALLLFAPQGRVWAALGVGLFLGLGILTKGGLAVLLLAFPLLGVAFARGVFNARKLALLALALAVAAALVWPWMRHYPWAENQAAWRWLLDWGPYGLQPWSYYWLWLALGLLPWTPLLLTACAVQPLARGPAMEAAPRAQAHFLALCAALGFAVLWGAPQQHASYLLPVLPPLALACGYLLSQFTLPGGRAEEALAWAQIATGVLAALFVASLPLWHPAIPLPGGREALAGFQALWWVASVVAAVCVLVVFYASARLWVQGKGLAAVVLIGVLVFFALAGWNTYWTVKIQNEARAVVAHNASN